MKYAVKEGNYSFNAATKTITLTGITVRLNAVIAIVNTTVGNALLYAPGTGNPATISGSDIILNAAVDTSGMANSNKLLIYYDYKATDPDPGEAPTTVAGTIAVSNLPATQPVSGTVAVSNFPATQPVSGTVAVSNFPSLVHIDDNGGSVTVDGTVGVNNFPAVQPINDNGGSITVDGSVSVSNFPATQPVSGTVAVSNFPATQPVSGTVTANAGSGTFATNLAQVAGTTTAVNSGVKDNGTQRIVIATDQPQLTNAWKVDGSAVTQPVSGSVSVSNFPSVYPINDNGGSITVDGSVTVSGTVTANIGTTNGLALDATLTGGTVKAIARGGAKGATTAADITSTAEGTDHQAIDVQLYHGGTAKDPTQIRALASGTDTVTIVPSGTQTVSGTVTANIGTTNGLALDATLTGGTAKSILRGGAKGSTTAADITSTASGANHQPVDVAIYDASGNQITSFGGGTQYTEDAVSAADPVGNMLMGRRRDTLTAAEVSTDGDNIAINASSKGQLHVVADGLVASGATDLGNPIKTGGKYNSGGITLTDGQRGDTQLDPSGRTVVTLGTLIAGEDPTNNIMGILEIPVSSSTYSPSNYKDNGSVTKANVKATPGNVYSVRVTNANSSARYFQIHNKATAPAAADTASRYWIVPAGSANNPGILELDSKYFAPSWRLSTGIGWAISTTATTFTDSATAGDHTYDINYV